LFNSPFFPQFSSVRDEQTPQTGLFSRWLNVEQRGLVFCGASFLVSVPVFIQAPLVRLNPWLTLILTLGWIGLGWKLWKTPKTQIWGDLLLGFSWSWFAGAIYWGWLRWEPLYHLPIEAIGLPFVLWCLKKRWLMVGNLFYLGSLFGTVITDVYFYLTDLLPYWRQVMQIDPILAKPIFQQALTQMHTLWGISWAVVLVNVLMGVGFIALQGKRNYWWAFAGAVLSTLFVDSLFWIVASLA
jgi:hypothetical protein